MAYTAFKRNNHVLISYMGAYNSGMKQHDYFCGVFPRGEYDLAVEVAQERGNVTLRNKFQSIQIQQLETDFCVSFKNEESEPFEGKVRLEDLLPK